MLREGSIGLCRAQPSVRRQEVKRLFPNHVSREACWRVRGSSRSYVVVISGRSARPIGG
jgi:hypothetical protein